MPRISRFPSPRQFILLLAAYFALHTLFRTLISATVELDESEQLILAQRLQFGYGVQPPLYTWLQAGLFRVFGTNIFALSLFKHTLLFGTYLFVYLGARQITRDHLKGMAASASLLVLPQIGWESHRDLTHSVLATTAASATWYIFFKLVETRETRLYCIWGLCWACGFLAKYNYIVLLVGMLAAACLTPQFRPVVTDRRMFFAVLSMLLPAMPHLVWIGFHYPRLLAHGSEFSISHHGSFLAVRLIGFENLILAMLEFAGPMILVYSLVLRKGLISGFAHWRHSLPTQIMVKTVLSIMVLLTGAALVFGCTNFKERWFQPILICLPLMLVAASDQENALSALKLRQLLIVSGIAALAMLVAIPGQSVAISYFREPSRLNAPFKELARQIAPVAKEVRYVIAENRWIGGNLRLIFPDKVVSVPELAAPDASFYEGKALLVWNATKTEEPPSVIARTFNTLGSDSDHSHPLFVEAPYRFDRSGKLFRLGLITAFLASEKAIPTQSRIDSSAARKAKQ